MLSSGAKAAISIRQFISARTTATFRRMKGVAAIQRKSFVRPSLVVDQSAAPHDSAALHNFTSGRFVCNEEYEKAQRYVKFDLHELVAIAARVVGAESCVKVTKLPEGRYNKALLLVMDNGKEVVARLPNPNAGRKHYTTASEVATMDFVASELAVPVPKVLTWSSRSDDNAVGAEYIIMEKAEGVPLETVWSRLGFEDRFAIVKAIADYQRTWAATPFPAYGSLYYASDLDLGMAQIPYCSPGRRTTNEYAIGPTDGRDWNDDGKMTIDFDRGPWISVLECLLAAGRRELSCVWNMPSLPVSPIQVCGPGLYQPTREVKAKAIQYYLDLMHTVVPTDPTLNTPCLWHGDLHEENIFVDPSNPTKITSIIDWQSTEIAPLFMHARAPQLFEHVSPTADLKRPRLPENMADLSPDEQTCARNLYLDQSLCTLYRIVISKDAPEVWKCLEFRETEAFNLITLARKLSVDGEAPYLAYLVDLLDRDTPDSGLNLATARLSIKFSDEERTQILSDVEKVGHGMDLLRDIRDTLDDLFPERGMVRNEQYEEAIDALQQMKEQVFAQYAKTTEDKAAWEKSWPFHN